MGTPEFAVPSLDILVKNNFNVVAVVTSKDSYGGRGGKQLIESAVKKYAMENNIPVLQPLNLKSESFVSELKSYKPDIIIVVAFRMLPEVIWTMPALGTFNLHGSLLPKYRGAAPINHAIINGDHETGVTFFKLKHEIDTGDILLKKKLPIYESDDAGCLHDRMMYLGAEVVLTSVKLIVSQKYDFIYQDDAEATKAPKIFHDTCRIDFTKSVEHIYNFVRGLSPYPSAWFKLENTEIKVIMVSKEFAADDNLPGTIISDAKKFVKIKCSNGYIHLLKIKQQGKKLMTASEFLNGNKIEATKINYT
jgi:methionyl-tRNA formyltransferase